MDEAYFVSRRFSRRRHQPEKLAERLPPARSRYAVEAAGQFLFEEGKPQLTRTARLSVTG